MRNELMLLPSPASMCQIETVDNDRTRIVAALVRLRSVMEFTLPATVGRPESDLSFVLNTFISTQCITSHWRKNSLAISAAAGELAFGGAMLQVEDLLF